MIQYFINSIYLGTEGEGIHVGVPQVFVRFQGCTVGCVNCDSKDTWEFKQFRTWDVSEIIAEVIKVGHQGKIKRVSITGGDPLHPKNVPAVIEVAAALKSLNYFVNLEAAGTRIVDEIFDRVDFISFDYKTPSTEVVTKTDLIETLYTKYPNRFQIKAVVSDERDFKSTLAARNEVALKVKINQAAWVLTPCFNVEENFPQERFQKVVTWNEVEGAPFRVIGQQHKWIHGPAKKFV
jgi:7-carboxy-7-deazaguanine synthase